MSHSLLGDSLLQNFPSYSSTFHLKMLSSFTYCGQLITEQIKSSGKTSDLSEIQMVTQLKYPVTGYESSGQTLKFPTKINKGFIFLAPHPWKIKFNATLSLKFRIYTAICAEKIWFFKVSFSMNKSPHYQQLNIEARIISSINMYWENMVLQGLLQYEKIPTLSGFFVFFLFTSFSTLSFNNSSVISSIILSNYPQFWIRSHIIYSEKL